MDIPSSNPNLPLGQLKSHLGLIPLKSNIVIIIATTSVSDLPNQVLDLEKSILYCAIVDKLGYIVASKERKPVQFIVSNKDAELGALHSAIRNATIPSWAQQFGKVYYVVTRHEKIIGATMRISKEHLMIVAFDQATNNFDEIIMRRVLPLIEESRSKRTLGNQE